MSCQISVELTGCDGISAMDWHVLRARRRPLQSGPQSIRPPCREQVLPGFDSRENALLGELFAAPAATERTLAALKRGGQTRQDERDLEGLLNSL